jgi:hypothetical protein
MNLHFSFARLRSLTCLWNHSWYRLWYPKRTCDVRNTNFLSMSGVRRDCRNLRDVRVWSNCNTPVEKINYALCLYILFFLPTKPIITWLKIAVRLTLEVRTYGSLALYMCMYMYVYIYIYTHTHTHTHISWWYYATTKMNTTEISDT